MSQLPHETPYQQIETKHGRLCIRRYDGGSIDVSVQHRVNGEWWTHGIIHLSEEQQFALAPCLCGPGTEIDMGAA